MQWQKVTLVGVGLLGGSLGLALKDRHSAAEVIGYVRRQSSIAECEAMQVVDRATLDLAEAVTGADLVILCTPIAQMRLLVEKMLPRLSPGTIVTDVGSVKGTVVGELTPLLAQAKAHFVGSHPMAGGEKMGVRAARMDLFHQALCVLTPIDDTPPAAVRQVEALWEMIGGRTMRLTPELHDELVCRSSHLPHIVAAELANYVLSPVHPREQAQLCANGFRDTTRIASGSPEMWRDIAVANGLNLTRILDVFIHELQDFKTALENRDWAAVESFFNQAKQRRDQWYGQNRSPE